MRSLKIAVIVMGGLIVAGIVIMVVALVQQAGDGAEEKVGAARPSAGAAAAIPLVNLPRGSTIQQMQVDGTRVTLLLHLGERRHRLLAVDLRTGELLGTVDLAQD